MLVGCNQVTQPTDSKGLTFTNTAQDKDIMPCGLPSCKYWLPCLCAELEEYEDDLFVCKEGLKLDPNSDRDLDLLTNANAVERINKGLENTACYEFPDIVGTFMTEDRTQLVVFEDCKDFSHRTGISVVGKDVYICNYKKYD